jgi:hypothetical protein
MNNQEYATAETLASIGITVAPHPKTGRGWGWSIQNDKIVRNWEGPYSSPACAEAAAMNWLLEHARKGLLCHHTHPTPVEDDLFAPWDRAFPENIPALEGE